MALFMKLPFAEGEARQAKHEGWVKLDLLQFEIDRSIAMEKGNLKAKAGGVPRFSEITIAKDLDMTSTALLRHLVGYDGGQDIEIHLVKGTQKSSEATVKYILKDALFTHYSVTCSGEIPYETLKIVYTGIEMKFYSYDASDRNVSSDNWVHQLAES